MPIVVSCSNACCCPAPVLLCSFAQARQLLVTVGLEEPGISTATIKVWEAERAATAAAAAASAASSAAAALSAMPQPASVSTTPANLPPLRVQKVFSNKYAESEVTALAVSEGGATGASLLVAVGLAAGAIYLFSGDVTGQKGKLQHAGKLQARPDSGDLWKVNALAFTQQQQQQQSKASNGQEPAAAAPATAGSKVGGLSGRAVAAVVGSTAQVLEAFVDGGTGSNSSDQQPGQWLYVVTESQTLAYHMADISKTILDQQGLAVGGCAAMKDDLLVLARDDALYEYTPDTRAGCTAFDGRRAAGRTSILTATAVEMGQWLLCGRNFCLQCCLAAVHVCAFNQSLKLVPSHRLCY